MSTHATHQPSRQRVERSTRVADQPARTSAARPGVVRPGSPLQTRRRSALGRVLRMTRFELAMIFKQRVAVLSIALAPMIAIGMALMDRPEASGPWMVMLSSMAILVLIVAVYNTVTSTVVARRETQVLKRLRTSELLPRQMLVALALPYVIVGVVQVVVVAVAYQLLGAPPMLTPGFAAVVLATAVLAVLGGFATAGIAATSERVQFAVLPVLLVGLVGAIFVLNPAAPDDYRALALLLPFAASSDLACRMLGASEDTFAVPAFVADLAEQTGVASSTLMSGLDVVLIVVWGALFAAAARRSWRWEPRG